MGTANRRSPERVRTIACPARDSLHSLMLAEFVERELMYAVVIVERSVRF